MALFDASASDAALVAEALKDNPAAFEKLVLRYQRRAHAIARAIGVPAGSVEDVVQETFLQALAGLRGLRAPAAFGPWLLAIARNLSRKEVAGRREPACPAAAEPAAAADAPGDAADLEEVREVLWREVARLPDGIREAIFLYYHEGESVRQVARALEVSTSAVKSRLQRGRDQLRERLWRELEGALREMVPSSREWRRRGRSLALLLVTAGASTRGSTASAGAAAPSTAGASGGLAHFLFTGGLVMSAKKVIAGAAVASLLLAGSIGIVRLAGPSRDAIEQAAAPAAPAPIAGALPGSRVEEAVEVVPAPSVTGISGWVLLEETSAPVAGARVAAVRDGERRHASGAETRRDGTYVLEGLLPGKYGLWAWREDLAPRRSGDPEVEVRQGEVARGQDLLLVPGVVIEGRIVEEGTRTPIGAAEIGFARLQFAASDADGRFRLEGIPEGLIAVTAIAPGHARRWIEIDAARGERPFVTIDLARGGAIEGTVTGPGGGPAAGAEVTVSGSGGGSARVDAEGRYRIDGVPLTATAMEVTASRDGRFATRASITGFPPGESRIALDLRLAEGYLLRGRVVDPAGRPLAGARIELMGSSIFEDLGADEEGRFAIDGAGDNMYTLHVRKEGRAPASVGLRELPPERREEIEVVLEEGLAVEGTVVDTEGAPLAGAFVYVEDGLGMSHRTTADTAGRFRIEDLPADLREIGADRSGYAMNCWEDVEAGRRDLRLVLEEAGKIEGIAVDAATGEPVHPVLVKVSFADGEFGERNREKGFGGGISSRLVEVGLPFDFPDGGFKIRHELAPGIFYRLLVVAPGHVEATVDGVEAWPRSEAREPVRIELERGGGLRGRVVDAATGETLEGVKVSHVADHRDRGRDYWWEDDRGERTAVRVALTGPEGSFEIDGLPEKPGVILLEKPGFARTAIADVGPGSEVETFELAAAAAIEGTVLGAAGEPIRGVAVAVAIDEEDFPRASTDERGSYRIDGLPPGKARVVAEGAGRLKKVRTATLVAGEATVVDFIEGGGAIAGSVTEGGKALPGAGVLVKRTSHPDEQEWLSTGGDGAFRTAGLEPGTYEVKAVRPNGGFIEGVLRTVEVGSGEVRCDITLGPAAALNGRVVDRVSGNAVPGAHVMLFKHHPGFFRTGLAFAGSDWGPIKGCPAEGDAASFRLDVSEAGQYLLFARAGDGKDVVQGWLGPLGVDPAGATDGVEVLVGGRAAAEVTVREATTGRPIEGATVLLRPAGGYPFGVGGRSDAAGAAVITRIPPGKYRLEVQGPDHLPALEDIDVGEAPLEREVALERGSWISVAIGSAGRPRSYGLRATVLAGGDPGWTFSTPDGKPATVGAGKPGEPAVRLKTRAGRYTVRFEVTSPHLSSPVVVARELEIDVPDGGEARVRLAPEG